MRIFAAIVLLVMASSAQALDVTQPPYNVVCDGVTDNTSGLQAALDSFCPSGKGEIELPKTGACKISGTIKARCTFGLTIIGNENAPDASKPVIRYTGSGPRAIDLRGVINFRSVGVAYEATNSYAGSLVDLTATYTCANSSLRACDTDTDCPDSTCTTNPQWASNVYFDLSRFQAPCSDTTDTRLLWIRHIVNLNLDRNVLRGGMYHLYGVDNDNEWTSVVNLSRNYFYTAGRASVFNMRWATNSTGNFWEPQGCDWNKARAFDHSAGVTVEGFYSHGDSFWDLAPANGFTETAAWIALSGRDIKISSRFESAHPSQMAQAVKIDSAQTSNGVNITGSYCKNLLTCWNLNSKAHKNVNISGNGYNNVGSTIANNSITGCAVNTANTLICD